MSNILDLFKGGVTLSGDEQDTLKKIEGDEARAQEREDQVKTERLQAELDRATTAAEKAEAELAGLPQRHATELAEALAQERTRLVEISVIYLWSMEPLRNYWTRPFPLRHVRKMRLPSPC